MARIHWEAVLKSKIGRECWRFYKKDILEMQDQAILVLKDKTAGKKTSLAEKRALAGTWVKKQSL